jgi:tetratricopeptide (TPR) repeat protein
MSTAPESENTNETADQRPSLIARGLQQLRPAARLPFILLKAAASHRLLTAVICTGSLIIGAAMVMMVHSLDLFSSVQGQEIDLQLAFEQLDAEDYEAAKQSAMLLQETRATDFSERGGPLFVMGAVIAHEAEAQPAADERAKLYLVAARLLGTARTEGIPSDREAQELFLRGRCLFLSGQQKESLPVLLAALKANAPQTSDIHRMLAIVYYYQPQGDDLKEALRHSRLALEDDSLPGEIRFDILLQQARILLELNRLEECAHILNELRSGPPLRQASVLIVSGRLQMQQAVEVQESAAGIADQQNTVRNQKYQEAIKIFRRAQTLDRTGIVSRQASYLIGAAYQGLEDDQAALEAFTITHRRYYRTPEALAARLAEAELLLAQHSYAAARDSLREVVFNAGEKIHYENPWVSWDELITRLTDACQQLLKAEQFELAISLTDVLDRVLPEDLAVATNAHAHETWGQALLRSAEGLSPLAARTNHMKAREQFREAAMIFGELAKLRYATAHYPEDLWSSGTNYLRGQNYLMAVRQMRLFLQNSDDRSQPRGLLTLGEAQLALGHYDEALQAFKHCIEQYARHPLTYKARIEASKVLQNLGRVAEAKELLSDNLHHESLTPRSLQWQESLFSLGKILFTEAREEEAKSRQNGVDSLDVVQRKRGLEDLKKAYGLFQQSLRYLNEAIQRYPDAPDTVEARYMAAQALRFSGLYHRKAIPVEPTQTRRNALARQMREDFDAAATSFLELQHDLNDQQETRELTEIEQAILRNTYFAYGDVLFDSGDYEAAISAYSTASNRYQHNPEALEAFVQIASSYRRLGADVEARGTLMQAASLLTRMPPDADFEQTTRYSREEWKELLGWLSQL